MMCKSKHGESCWRWSLGSLWLGSRLNIYAASLIPSGFGEINAALGDLEICWDSSTRKPLLLLQSTFKSLTLILFPPSSSWIRSFDIQLSEPGVLEAIPVSFGIGSTTFLRCIDPTRHQLGKLCYVRRKKLNKRNFWRCTCRKWVMFPNRYAGIMMVPSALKTYERQLRARVLRVTHDTFHQGLGLCRVPTSRHIAVREERHGCLCTLQLLSHLLFSHNKTTSRAHCC